MPESNPDTKHIAIGVDIGGTFTDVVVYDHADARQFSRVQASLLLVEDSRLLREQIVIALKRSGYAVDAVEDGKEGLWLAQNHSYDGAILDIMVPGLDGLSLLKELRASGDETPTTSGCKRAHYALTHHLAVMFGSHT